MVLAEPSAAGTAIQGKRAWRWAAAVASGVLYVGALPGAGWWPLAFFALVPVCLAWNVARLWEGMALGIAMGMVAAVLGLAWLPETLRTFLGCGSASAWTLAVLVGAVESVRFAILGAFYVLARRSRGSALWPLAWSLTSAELLAPSVFPHSFAASLHDSGALLQPIELTGRVGLVALLAVVNAGLVHAIGTGGSLVQRLRPALFSAAAVLFWAAGGEGLRQLATERTESGEPVRLAAVQAGVGAEQKRRAPGLALAAHRELTRDYVRREHPDIVVWSEAAIASPIPLDGFGETLGRRVGPSLAPALVTGVLIAAGPGKFTNSAAVHPQSAACTACRYDKQILLPVAERLPFGSALPGLREWFPSGGRMHAGPASSSMVVGARRAAVLICYEALYPRHVRALVRAESEIIIQLANDDWFAGTTAHEMHQALVRLLAVEHRRFVLRSTTNGPSALIAPTGDVQSVLGYGEAGVLDGRAVWLTTETLHTALGDAPAWLLVLAGAVSIGRARLARFAVWRRIRARLVLSGRIAPELPKS